MSITLLQYRDKWYQCSQEARIGLGSRQLFDIIIQVDSDNTYNIIKNRYAPDSESSVLTDVLKMKLWVHGKSFVDLPKFIDDGDIWPGPVELSSDSDGHLHAGRTWIVTMDSFN